MWYYFYFYLVQMHSHPIPILQLTGRAHRTVYKNKNMCYQVINIAEHPVSHYGYGAH